MAAFSSSFQQLIDSSSPVFMANSHHHHHQSNNINGGGFCHDFYQSEQNLQSNLDHHNSSTKLVAASNNNNNINEGSVFSHVTKKNISMDNSSSIVTDKYYCESSEQITAQKPTMDKKRKLCKDASNSPNSAQSKDMRGVKGKKQRKIKDGEEKKKLSKEEEKKLGGEKEVPAGYIHVRARRGQATDSHSLAERVRRERISERMKLLQDLVPGCEKVTGKALMLDEIINYVQSLQNQVEFLSMKLASVNPMFYDFGMDLESFMVRPDQNLSSPLAGLQQCNPTTPILDNSDNSLMFQQPQIPNSLPLGHRQMLWEVEEQRQKIINQAGMISNTLFPFH